MPLQNRVTPFNVLEAAPERGTLMGNRGILHDAGKRIGVSKWKHKRWLACRTLFKGRKRGLMVPGEYTALFFLDEAVSLAAGHRPCKECRRTDHERFLARWIEAHQPDKLERPSVDVVDEALHRDRVDGRRQRRHGARLGDLPDGAMLVLPEEPDQAFLLWRDELHRWSHGGYVVRRAVDPDVTVEVLTPRATVEVIRRGYEPAVHPTAL